MYSVAAFKRSAFGSLIGLSNWNLNHSEKFGMFWAILYDLSHSDTLLFRIFTAKVPYLINVYVCILYIVDAMPTAGITGQWLTLLSLIRVFQD
jgi:hypothetical protein